MVKKRPPWYYGRLEYDLMATPYCCSLGEIGCLYINTYDQYGFHEKYQLSQMAVSSEVKRMTQELKKRKLYGFIASFTEKTEGYKFYIKAFTNAGWKLLMTYKTCHGNYKVFTFGKSFKT